MIVDDDAALLPFRALVGLRRQRLQRRTIDLLRALVDRSAPRTVFEMPNVHLIRSLPSLIVYISNIISYKIPLFGQPNIVM